MNSLDRLRAAISRKTDLDPFGLTDEVVANFFDDKLDIIGDILKHKEDPMMIGKILIDLLDSTIEGAVNEAESLSMDNAAELLANFNRTEAAGYNQVLRRIA